MMVAARHTPVLRLLRSKCTAVRESVALLMGAMIRDSPGNVPELIRTAALSEGKYSKRRSEHREWSTVVIVIVIFMT